MDAKEKSKKKALLFGAVAAASILAVYVLVVLAYRDETTDRVMFSCAPFGNKDEISIRPISLEKLGDGTINHRCYVYNSTGKNVIVIPTLEEYDIEFNDVKVPSDEMSVADFEVVNADFDVTEDIIKNGGVQIKYEIYDLITGLKLYEYNGLATYY